MLIWLRVKCRAWCFPLNYLKTFPISESRESSLALPSVGNEGAANLIT